MHPEASTSFQDNVQTRRLFRGGTLERMKKMASRGVTGRRVGIVCVLLVILLLGGLIGYFIGHSSGRINDLTSSSQGLQDILREQGLSMSLGMRNDYLLQDCGKDTHLKQSFPDVDYSLFGYDILKGFPLAEGHDPGFTLPIFRADYSIGGQSVDCRFSVPKGLVIVPDVSCVTSFTSEIIKTQRGYAESLSVSAGVEAGGWGVSFSLSAGYRKASSELESKQKVFVISTAKCNYYFSKLVTSSAPPFNPDFLKWIKKLEHSDNIETYMQFFDTYGTHYPYETLFGARYTFENSMTQSEFESKESSGMNIAMSAGYSGMFSVGASFSMDSSQEQMAKDFRKNVETKTVTVGASPPADGDAMKWASSVQSNPVPVYYRLSSIEKLFTADFMEGSGIDYIKIHKNLLKYKHGYQYFLNKKEFLKDCRGVDQSYIVFENTALSVYKYREKGTLFDCLAICFKDPGCLGISMHDNACDFSHGQGPEHHLSAYKDTKWTTYILWKDNRKTIKMFQTGITGEPFKEESRVYSVSQCEDLCLQYDRCFAMTYTDMCRLYEREKVYQFIKDPTTSTTIVSKCADVDVALGQHLLNS